MEALITKATGMGGLLAAVLVLVGGIIGRLIANQPKNKELDNNRESALIKDLVARVTKLESDLNIERNARTNAGASLRDRLADAEYALDLFIELIELNPNRPPSTLIASRPVVTRIAIGPTTKLPLSALLKPSRCIYRRRRCRAV